MNPGNDIISLVADRQDLDQFRKKTWEGTFEQYLELVRGNPHVTRNAFQRVYDMIMSYGTQVYEGTRGEKRVHYRFFDDPDDGGRDAVFGLDGPLETLVHALKSAAQGYGIEKRVLLLHGPVGSSKSTIARLLKKGLERYSAGDEGALYTLGWVDETSGEVHWCPMNEEPLHLIPQRFRQEVEQRLCQCEGQQREGVQGAQARRRSWLHRDPPPEFACEDSSPRPARRMRRPDSGARLLSATRDSPALGCRDPT